MVVGGFEYVVQQYWLLGDVCVMGGGDVWELGLGEVGGGIVEVEEEFDLFVYVWFFLWWGLEGFYLGVQVQFVYLVVVWLVVDLLVGFGDVFGIEDVVLFFVFVQFGQGFVDEVGVDGVVDDWVGDVDVFWFQFVCYVLGQGMQGEFGVGECGEMCVVV